MDPSDFNRVYNDPFLKRYLTALIKKQWGQNLIKFQVSNYLVVLSSTVDKSMMMLKMPNSIRSNFK